ncbi:cytochrome P450 CYP82D47-like [Aristolochia californica]|uniref:cytochrome P450 CYP82D47-like n=1 Tax=Aristolochia californica TaxID=171875 RepID=UPI0035D64CD3
MGMAVASFLLIEAAMEIGILLPQQAMIGLLAFLFAFGLWKSWSGGKKAGAVSTPPDVPGRWPIIGHVLKLMDDKMPLARTLGDLADKHGPLFTVWIGVHRTVVVNNWEMAKECYTTSDKALASRPSFAAWKYLGYDYAILGFTPYGPYWREIRKIVTLELLSARQLELLKDVRATEVDLSIKALYQQWIENKNVAIKVEMKDWFGTLTFNNVVMTVVGKRYFGTNTVEDANEVTKFNQAISDLTFQTGNPTPSDAFPMLERFDIGGRIRAMKKTAQELDSLCSIWLKEHRLRRLSGNHGPDQDFLDVMLTVLDKSDFADYDADTVIKATCLTMILGGTDTSSITMTWAICLLLNNRHALKKAQEELDAQVGKERNVNESDIKNLPYLCAIVKETLRLYPAAPLAIPHEAMEDCSVGGFKIPSCTWLMVNVWKIQRDPRIWPDPLKFMPERFLTTNASVDLKGQHYELLPFGSGRRVCPGAAFALQVLHLALARLLHGFDVDIPFDEPIDMTETAGITNPKATPLHVLLSPRLPAHLYH